MGPSRDTRSVTCVCTFVWDENCGLLCLVCTDVLDENSGRLPVCCGLWVQKVSLVGILGAAETLFDRDPGYRSSQRVWIDFPSSAYTGRVCGQFY